MKKFLCSVLVCLVVFRSNLRWFADWCLHWNSFASFGSQQTDSYFPGDWKAVSGIGQTLREAVQWTLSMVRLNRKKCGPCYTGKTSISIPESSGFFVSVGRLERLWDNGMKVRHDFWRKTIGRCTKQPFKNKDIFIRVPQSLSRRPSADKKAWGLWDRDWENIRSDRQF